LDGKRLIVLDFAAKFGRGSHADARRDREKSTVTAAG
jgi:hypothetical protein